MNTIASVLAAMGHRVSGSDQRPSPVLERLELLGVHTFVGHEAANVGEVDAVAYSAAVPSDNVELAEARRRGVPTVPRAGILAAICATRRTLAVSGTHGKTTTTAMLAAILTEAGMKPSFMVGGELAGGRGGAYWGDGQWLVVEADESDGTFLGLPAEGALVTSIEADHLDHFGDLAGLEAAFSRFLGQAPGPRVVCLDDPGVARLAEQWAGPALISYGEAATTGFHVREVELVAAGASFSVVAAGQPLGRFHLSVPGRHNVQNAAGALAMAVSVGCEPEAARAALAAYRNVARRFELRGKAGGVTFVDDYAHNPGKVRAVLAAARLGGWRRVVAVFQPHRYSRTSALWEEFGRSFGDADVVIVTSVYPAGEHPLPGVSGRLVADAVRAHAPSKKVHYVEDRAALVPCVRGVLRPGDLCLTMSAGDLTTLPDELLAELAGEHAAPAPPPAPAVVEEVI